MAHKQPKHSSLSNLLGLNAVYKKNSALGDLLNQATALESIEQLFNRCLPTQLRGKFQLNSMHNRCLTLTCTSASLATRFRMQQKEIIQALNGQLPRSPIERIQIKIRPVRAQHAAQLNRRHISKENARLLEQEAGQTADKKLRDVLRRLAGHADQPNP